MAALVALGLITRCKVMAMNAINDASIGPHAESGGSLPAKPKRYQAPTLVKSAVLSVITAQLVVSGAKPG